MPISDIQIPETKYILTGWGPPLVYAPEKCQLACVGPMDPIKWINILESGSGYLGARIAGMMPLVQWSTPLGSEWRESEPYKHADPLSAVEPSIKSVYDYNLL